MGVVCLVLQEACYRYWSTSGVQQVGEFSVEQQGEEKLEGFVMRSFGVLHKKVRKKENHLTSDTSPPPSVSLLDKQDTPSAADPDSELDSERPLLKPCHCH